MDKELSMIKSRKLVPENVFHRITSYFFRMSYMIFCFPATHEGVLNGSTTLPKNQVAALRMGSNRIIYCLKNCIFTLFTFVKILQIKMITCWFSLFPSLTIGLDNPTPSLPVAAGSEREFLSPTHIFLATQPRGERRNYVAENRR